MAYTRLQGREGDRCKDMDYVKAYLEEKHVAVVPGNAFNRAGEGYIRIACTLEEETLVAAARAIVDFADSRCQ